MFPHLEVPLRTFADSRARLSTAPGEKTAIVFIHGLNGHHWETWAQFQTLADQLQSEFPIYGRSDLFFFSYDSHRDVPESADLCLQFIRAIFPTPNPSLLLQDEVLTYPPDSSHSEKHRAITFLPAAYKDLILVGHSLGGLLIRTAIWWALRDASNPKDLADAGMPPGSATSEFLRAKDRLLSAELALFAPAMLGSSVPKWAAQLIGMLAGIPLGGEQILKTIGLIVPSIADLQEGDLVLSDVRKYTEEAAETFAALQALYARVMWGKKDTLLKKWQYKYDKAFFEDQKGHVAICKPSLGYKKPLAFVTYGKDTRSATN